MYKLTMFAKTTAILVFVASLTQTLHAQKKIDDAKIRSLIESNASAIRMSSSDRQSGVIKNAYYSSQSGVFLVYLQQTYKGVDVYNAIQTLAFKDDKLVSSTGAVIPKIASRVNNTEGTPALRPENAVMAAARHLNLPVASSAKPIKYTAGDKEAEFGNLGISSENIKTNLVWMPVNNGRKLVLCWQVQVQPNKTPDHWLVRIDAATGEYVNKSNLTVKCNWTIPHNHTNSCYVDEEYAGEGDAPVPGNFKDPASINSAKYRVLPYPFEAPNTPGAAPAVVTNPWTLSPANSPATSLKWNDDGNNSYAITRGNNVYAQEDHDANDNTIGKPGKSITPVPDLNFDYAVDFDGEPTDSLNMGFALTNLFYWNNIMHDLTYQYGFDEVAGNFQANNQGRGGKGNDYVIADGQDAVDVDNSNFATPADGNSPRMQMFLFDLGVLKTCYINSPTNIKGYRAAREGNVSTKNKLADVGPVTANLAAYKDATSGNRACAVATNAAELKGKIALISRGACNFSVKIKNAQNAGAVGVIMIDTVPDGILVTMTATPSDNTIKIPAVFTSKDDGGALLSLVNGGTTLNATLKQHILDGSVDAGVMDHEYTHGISNRLTGGPANVTCLENAEQMGEGWSDYYALMATTNWKTAQFTDGSKARPIGTYVLDESANGPGIRSYPYSTNMSTDPWTYDSLKSHTDGGEEHLVGEIWCTALWEMTWTIIQQDGVINTDFFNANNAGGNSVAFKLVTEGMKLQRCSPGFIDGRDAILKADTLLYNGKYSCSIWKAFAKRGMGLKASQGSGNSITDQVIDFTLPNNAAIVKHVDKDTVAQTDVLTYTITAACKCVALNNLKIVDTLPSNVTYISGGTYNAANRTVTFSGISLGVSQSSDFTVKVKVNSGTYFKPGTVFADSVNSSTVPTAAWQLTSSTNTPWAVATTRHHTGSYSYFAKDSSSPNDEMLVTKQAYAINGISKLSFWHYFDTEDGYDGGVVEASKDNGATWFDLGPYMVQNGYNNTIDPNNGTILSGRSAFSGASSTFINTIVDLSSFSGKSLKFRFSFANDDVNDANGWYIDDILLTKVAAVVNKVQLFDNADAFVDASDTISYIKEGAVPVKLGNFTAQKIKQTASQLSWQTFQELNSSKFVIERSADGSDFSPIGTVTAAGNSNSTLNYQFIDEAPLQGNNYYRLKEVDKNESYAYSAVKLLNFGDLTGIISITPNPAKDKIAITVGGNNKALKVYLVNTNGQRLATYNMTGQYLEAKLPVIAAGVYYIRIEGGGVSSQHKLVVAE